MRVRLRAKDAMSHERSMAKAFAWGALVMLALSYCGPYSYLRHAPDRLVGIWGTEVPEAHRITLCVAVACILALLAARAGRPPGAGMWLTMHAVAVVGLALSLVTPFIYLSAARKAGLGIRMQGGAAIMAFFAVLEAGGLGKPRGRRQNRDGDQ